MAVILIASVFGCARFGDQAGGASDLPKGRTFLSTKIMADGQPVPWDGRISLSFTDKEINGNAGCNHLFGAARLDGDTLTVKSMGTTDMGCPGPRMAQDQWLVAFLTAGPTWALDGNTLTLTAGRQELTLLDREVADPDKPLAGVRWTIDTLVTGQAASSVPAVALPFLQFAEDQTFTGNDGCNTLRGKYTYNGDQLTVSEVASTKMRCGDPAGEVANTVNAVLAEPMTVSIEANRLSLTAPDGTGLGATAA